MFVWVTGWLFCLSVGCMFLWWLADRFIFNLFIVLFGFVDLVTCLFVCLFAYVCILGLVWLDGWFYLVISFLFVCKIVQKILLFIQLDSKFVNYLAIYWCICLFIYLLTVLALAECFLGSVVNFDDA